MKKHVEIIEKVPVKLFENALKEISQIDWDIVSEYDNRSKTPDGKNVFKTSTAIHLRVHDATESTPKTIKALSDIVECKDTIFRKKYSAVNELCAWIYNIIGGNQLGRIMIVKLQSNSDIPLHIDPGKYFQSYYRFHVPIITDENILFINEEEEKIHMPLGHLCQLNNRSLHGVRNNSTNDRIHIIVDIDSKKENFVI